MKKISCILALLIAGSAFGQPPMPTPIPVPEQPVIRVNCTRLLILIEEANDELLTINQQITKKGRLIQRWTELLNLAIAEQQRYLLIGEPTPPGVLLTIGDCRAFIDILETEIDALRDSRTWWTAEFGKLWDWWIAAGC